MVDLTTTSNLRGSLLLNAQGAGFNLNDFGLPTLIFRAPDLITKDATTGQYQVSKPEVFLDVRITEALKLKILDLLGTIDDSGNAALSNGLLNNPIPGLGKSVNDILQVPKDSLGNITAFGFKAAAQVYLDSFSYTTNSFPSLSGLSQVLQKILSKDLSVPFNTTQRDWSGFDFSGYDFSKFSIDALRDFNFRGANLSGANFQGLDLSGVDFSGANLQGAIFDALTSLRGVKFSGADLRGINWTGIDLRGLDLQGVNLSGVNFSGFDLSRINFRGANLTGVNLSGANLRWSNLTGTNLVGADLRKVFALDVTWSSIFSSDLRFNSTTQVDNMLVDLNLSSLFGSLSSKMKKLQVGLDLSGMNYNWSKLDLSGIDFSGVNLTGIDFSSSNLSRVKFHGSSLSNMNLSNAFGWNIDWGSGQGTTGFSGVTGINLSGFLSNVALPSFGGSSGTYRNWTSGLNLSGQNFDWSGWDLSGVDFGGIQLGDMDFSWSNLCDASFTGTLFGLVNWTGSTWKGIDLSGLTLKGIFRNVDFSGVTFPAGVNIDFTGLDFSGAKFRGSIGFENLLGQLYDGWSSLPGTLDSRVKIKFDWVDLSGLDLTSWSLPRADVLQFGDFQGANFSKIKFPGLGTGESWDLSGLNLSMSSWTGVSVGGTTQFSFGLSNLTGADLSGIADKIGSAAKAFYDGATSFGSATLAFITGLNMDSAFVDSMRRSMALPSRSIRFLNPTGPRKSNLDLGSRSIKTC